MAKLGQDGLDRLSQQLITGVSGCIQPLILHLSPQAFCFVQVWTVSWQEKHIQACLLPAFKTSLKCLRTMHRSIVQHQHRRAVQATYPLINTANHKPTVNTHLASKTDQTTGLIKPGQHVESAAGLTGPFQRMACPLPAIRHDGHQTEPRFIALEQVDPAFSGQGLQISQALQFVHIISGSKQSYAPSDTLPAPATLFKKRWSVLWLNSRFNSWRRACRAVFNGWTWALTCWLIRASSAGVRMGLRPWPG